jgi:hypothetical protein
MRRLHLYVLPSSAPAAIVGGVVLGTRRRGHPRLLSDHAWITGRLEVGVLAFRITLDVGHIGRYLPSTATAAARLHEADCSANVGKITR